MKRALLPLGAVKVKESPFDSNGKGFSKEDLVVLPNILIDYWRTIEGEAVLPMDVLDNLERSDVGFIPIPRAKSFAIATERNRTLDAQGGSLRKRLYLEYRKAYRLLKAARHKWTEDRRQYKRELKRQAIRRSQGHRVVYYYSVEIVIPELPPPRQGDGGKHGIRVNNAILYAQSLRPSLYDLLSHNRPAFGVGAHYPVEKWTVANSYPHLHPASSSQLAHMREKGYHGLNQELFGSEVRNYCRDWLVRYRVNTRAPRAKERGIRSSYSNLWLQGMLKEWEALHPRPLRWDKYADMQKIEVIRHSLNQLIGFQQCTAYKADKIHPCMFQTVVATPRRNVGDGEFVIDGKAADPDPAFRLTVPALLNDGSFNAGLEFTKWVSGTYTYGTYRGVTRLPSMSWSDLDNGEEWLRRECALDITERVKRHIKDYPDIQSAESAGRTRGNPACRIEQDAAYRSAAIEALKITPSDRHMFSLGRAIGELKDEEADLKQIRRFLRWTKKEKATITALALAKGDRKIVTSTLRRLPNVVPLLEGPPGAAEKLISSITTASAEGRLTLRFAATVYLWTIFGFQPLMSDIQLLVSGLWDLIDVCRRGLRSMLNGVLDPQTATLKYGLYAREDAEIPIPDKATNLVGNRVRWLTPFAWWADGCPEIYDYTRPELPGGDPNILCPSPGAWAEAFLRNLSDEDFAKMIHACYWRSLHKDSLACSRYSGQALALAAQTATRGYNMLYSMMDPVTTTWELTPLSFVLDWFAATHECVAFFSNLLSRGILLCEGVESLTGPWASLRVLWNLGIRLPTRVDVKITSMDTADDPGLVTWSEQLMRRCAPKLPMPQRWDRGFSCATSADGIHGIYLPPTEQARIVVSKLGFVSDPRYREAWNHCLTKTARDNEQFSLFAAFANHGSARVECSTYAYEKRIIAQPEEYHRLPISTPVSAVDPLLHLNIDAGKITSLLAILASMT